MRKIVIEQNSMVLNHTVDIRCELFLLECNDFKMLGHRYHIQLSIIQSCQTKLVTLIRITLLGDDGFLETQSISMRKVASKHLKQYLSCSSIKHDMASSFQGWMEKKTYCALLCKHSIIKQCLHGNIAKH